MMQNSKWWVPFPTGHILAMINRMVQNNPQLRHPITLEDLLRGKDRYLELAAQLN